MSRIKRFFARIGRGIWAAPMGVLRIPIRIYRRVVAIRNWVLAKITYLNDESAKWKTTFNILKSPYTLLRFAGFSPQMAVGVLFAGSTVGTGVVVEWNESVKSKTFWRIRGEYNNECIDIWSTLAYLVDGSFCRQAIEYSLGTRTNDGQWRKYEEWSETRMNGAVCVRFGKTRIEL